MKNNQEIYIGERALSVGQALFNTLHIGQRFLILSNTSWLTGMTLDEPGARMKTK